MVAPPVSLPSELWLEIFGIATYLHPRYYPEDAIIYWPYQSIIDYDPSVARRVVEKHTQSIGLVCKTWRRIALPILYRHAVVNRRLLSALCDPKYEYVDFDSDLAGLIRHITIDQSTSSLSHEDVHHTLSKLSGTTICSIQWSSLLESHLMRNSLLDRYDAGLPARMAPGFSLRLRRLDWFVTFDDTNLPQLPWHLTQVLSSMENLEYLSITQINAPRRLHTNTSDDYIIIGKLPALTTLHLRTSMKQYLVLLDSFASWDLPKLLNLKLDAPVREAPSFWDLYGPQLKTLELGCTLFFGEDDDHPPGEMLLTCINLEEICYFMFSMIPPTHLTLSSQRHPKLKYIRLHTYAEGAIVPSYIDYDELLLQTAQAHFNGWCDIVEESSQAAFILHAPRMSRTAWNRHEWRLSRRTSVLELVNGEEQW